MEITRSRPIGITILAVLLAIQGVLELVFGLITLFAAPGFVTAYGNTAVVVHISPWGFLISGIVSLALVYGLWTLRNWAFWVIVVVEMLNLIGGTIQLFTTYYPGAVLLSMVIPAVILIYFFADSNVRAAFNA